MTSYVRPCVLSMTMTLLLVTYCAAQHDDTLTPGASGHEVVESTLTRIESAYIFPDDKLLLRRMAYVESSDGKHPKTYRDGYHGAIWQVRILSVYVQVLVYKYWSMTTKHREKSCQKSVVDNDVTHLQQYVRV